MPELPEVQTLIDSLIEEKILNLEILKVEVFLDKLIKNASPLEFKNFLMNEKILAIERVGKYLIFKLSNDKVMSVHLRMEGKIFVDEDLNKEPEKHTLLVIWLKDKKVSYHDTRKFGTFHIFNNQNYMQSKELSKIAIDPINPDFSWKDLKEAFQKCNKFIKTAILDQTKVSGIGNIYADEILFASKINPFRKANSITDDEWKKIAKSATKILKKAIENKGTTIFSYLFKKDSGGQFQKFLQVHLKKDQACKVCKTMILKEKINGRGSYYCPKCQF